MMMSILAGIAIIVLLALAVCRFLRPSFQKWFWSSGEEKMGLSKNNLYNANGYIMHSGSDILLGSTGSFQRFDSVDRNAGQTPPWVIETRNEAIPPQPLRLAPCAVPSTIKAKTRGLSNSPTSAPVPIKSVPRPVARKQLSAPTSSAHPHLINPPKEVRAAKATTNPFANGLTNLESIETNAFSSMVVNECNFENERVSQSAFISKNPFIQSSMSSELNVFDFNPTTIRSVLEETKEDDGYQGDSEEKVESDSTSRFEKRVKKLETASKPGRESETSSPNKFSHKILQESPAFEGDAIMKFETNFCDKAEFDESSFNGESMIKIYQKHPRNRSFSENRESDISAMTASCENVDPMGSFPQSTANPFKNGKRLLKTPSETYLETFSMMRAYQTSNSANNKSSLLKPLSNQNVQNSELLFDASTKNSSSIKRVASSESISSDSSVVFNKLVRTAPPVTGTLGISLQFDKHSATEEGCELLVNVLEARDLMIPQDADPDCVDTFVRIYLLPDAQNKAVQTKIFKNSRHPSYQETFGFFIRKENIRRSLWFHLYHTSSQITTLIGETEMKITDFRKPTTCWLNLSDSRNNCSNYGDLMFSLSYLPTAERLTVVVVKARNLLSETDENENQSNAMRVVQSVFVKVYLLKDNKKVSKKRTTTKRGERNFLFNEALTYSIPVYLLNSIQVRLTIMNVVSTSDGTRKSLPIGHVIVGSRTDGKGILHWHQMLMSLRKPIAMFHPLRRSSNSAISNGINTSQ